MQREVKWLAQDHTARKGERRGLNSGSRVQTLNIYTLLPLFKGCCWPWPWIKTNSIRLPSYLRPGTKGRVQTTSWCPYEGLDIEMLWHHWLHGLECPQTPGDSERQGGLACFSPWGGKETDMTEWLNNISVRLPGASSSEWQKSVVSRGLQARNPRWALPGSYSLSASASITTWCSMQVTFLLNVPQLYWIRTHLHSVWPHLNLIMSAKTLFPNKGHIYRYWGLGLEHILNGNTVQPMTQLSLSCVVLCVR